MLIITGKSSWVMLKLIIVSLLIPPWISHSINIHIQAMYPYDVTITNLKKKKSFEQNLENLSTVNEYVFFP